MNYILLIFSTLYLNFFSQDNIKHFIVENNKIIYYDLDFNALDSLEIKHNLDYKLSEWYLKPLQAENELFFLGNHSGEVFKIQNESLLRIDNTLDHRGNVNASIFIHNDTIFKFGGYGYWDNKNFITYFDKENREWELYEEDGFIPKGHIDGFYSINKQEIIFFGGNYVDKRDRLNPKPNNEVVKFNFTNHSYDYLGEFNSDILSNKIYQNLLINHEYSIFISKQATLVKVIPFENKIIEYKLPANLLSKTSVAKKNKIIGDYLYTVSYDDFKNRKLWKISLDELFVNPIEEYEMYKKPIHFNYYWIIIASLAILIFILAFKLYSGSESAIIKGNGLIFEGGFYEFNSNEIKLIKSLNLQNTISTNDLLDLLKLEEISYSHQIRLKDQFIQNLNIKLKTIFKVYFDVIIQKADEKDKRIKNYTINSFAEKYFLKVKFKEL